MNPETIPDNNLPVYLQKYNVKIFNDKKESVGNVLYTTVGAIPSNEKEERVWSLNLTGYLKPNVDKYNIIYDFSKVYYKYKDEITFENIVSGTFNICGRVLDASKIIGFDYKYNDDESTLTIELDTSKWEFRLKKEVLFSYNLNVDDSRSPNVQCSLPYNLDTGKSYKMYLGIQNCYINSCGTETTDVLIQDSSDTNRFYAYFNINKYPSFNFQSSFLTSYGGSLCDDGSGPKYIQLFYPTSCVTLKTGTQQKITVNSESLKVTYTYSENPPGVNIWTAICCQGKNKSISDYYVGTIEFDSL